MRNTLSGKYLGGLSGKESSGPLVQKSPEKDTLGDVGYLRPHFVAVGTYYCSAIDQFGHFEDGIIDPITDGAGRSWRLVSTDYLQWMAGMIQRAFDNVATTDFDLGVAILKFYRVRDRLEQEIAAADGCPAGGLQKPGGAGAVGPAVAVSEREPGDESEAEDAELAAVVAA